MEKLKKFNPRTLFEGQNKIIFRGGMAPWSVDGHTKLKKGGKIDVPLSAYNLAIPLSAVFDIERVDVKKAKDIKPDEMLGNIPHPRIYLQFSDEAVTPDSEVTVVHIDPESISFVEAPMPKRIKQDDGSYSIALC